MPVMQVSPRSLLAVVLLSVVLFGCATTQSIDQSKRTRTFEADYLSTFKASLDYFNERGFAVAMVDKDLGIINTDYRENDGVAKFFLGNYRAKINLSLRAIPDKTQTKIIATISAEKMESNIFQSRWVQATMGEGEAADYYTKVFNGIQYFLNGGTGPMTTDSVKQKGEKFGK